MNSSFVGETMNLRIARGFLWGTVATVAMTLTHFSIWAVEGQLTIHNMVTRMMPSNIITKVFGSGLPVSTHLLLAALIHLGYGAFWGAILFGLTKQVTFLKGVAMGAFLYLGARIFLSPLLGSRPLAAGALLSWFSIATHFTYGATLGLLGAWRDRVAEVGQVATERAAPQIGSQRPVVSR